ncbi:MAG TPA: DNA polymerase III subunit delta [Bacteroidales bacterium]|nr:DNA polymerase III subunit delta [Bacteroidales bacterium]
MNYTDIISNLRKRIFHPVYLLSGEESYYIDEITRFAEQHILSESEKEFDQFVLYGEETEVATIINTCRRFPALGSHLVVIVKEAQQLNKPENLLPYLEKPAPTTLLFLCHKHKKADGRSKMVKTIEKHGVLFESKPLYENQVPGWITKYLKDRNYSIQESTALMLSEYLGTNLSKIVNELNKLFINIPAGAMITGDMIEHYIGISKEYNVFEFQNALGAKDILRANRIAAYFAANPKENHLLMIIPILYHFFVKVMIYHQLKNKSRKDAMAALGVSFNIAENYEKAARNYSLIKCENTIGLLKHYDGRVKGIGNESSTEGELLKEMVYKILH